MFNHPFISNKSLGAKLKTGCLSWLNTQLGPPRAPIPDRLSPFRVPWTDLGQTSQGTADLARPALGPGRVDEGQRLFWKTLGGV